MTVIAAVARDGKVLMGADSLTLFGSEKAIRTVPKIFRSGPLLIGVAGSPRVSDALRYEGPQPFMDVNQDAYKLMAQAFVPWLRETAKQAGLLMSHEGQDVLMGNSMLLIGYRGTVFTVSFDFSVVTYADGYTAIGSASAYALGAMHAVHNDEDWRPDAMLDAGLKAAVAFSTDAAPPFTVLELDATL